MNHSGLFQDALSLLNRYTAMQDGVVVTASQRIALARALEALYSACDGAPSLSIQVDVSASLIAPQKAIESQVVFKQGTQDKQHTFDAINSIKSLSPVSHIDDHTRLIAN